jgi:hypothetical protein
MDKTNYNPPDSIFSQQHIEDNFKKQQEREEIFAALRTPYSSRTLRMHYLLDR